LSDTASKALIDIDGFVRGRQLGGEQLFAVNQRLTNTPRVDNMAHLRPVSHDKEREFISQTVASSLLTPKEPSQALF
jgi:hypothetical protein